jgi:hypothetical protein
MAKTIKLPLKKGQETVNTVRFYEELPSGRTGPAVGLYMTRRMLAEIDSDATDLVITVTVGTADPYVIRDSKDAGKSSDGKSETAASPTKEAGTKAA